MDTLGTTAALQDTMTTLPVTEYVRTTMARYEVGMRAPRSAKWYRVMATRCNVASTVYSTNPVMVNHARALADRARECASMALRAARLEAR